MLKTVICRTLTMSTIIIYSLVFIHGHHVFVKCLRTQDSSQYMHVLKESSLVWPDPFLAQGIYHLQCKHPAKALDSSMIIMLCMYCSLYMYLYVLKYLAGSAHNCM